jgi:pSer/pThr/pTyr-binding forkhead associated (FHA) protein/tetratricopeptide (TPR) repeat protein
MKIKVFKANKLLKEFDVKKDDFVLGRTESCDICIPEENISRKHIGFTIKDNQTLFFFKKAKFAMITKDGEDIEKGELKDGESLSIGDVTVILDATEGETAEKPKVTGNDFDFFTMSADVNAYKEEPVVLEPEKEKTITPEKTKEETEAIIEEKDVAKNLLEKEQKSNLSDATMVGPANLLYQLIAISGPHKDKVFTLDKNIMIAGRGKKVEISLIDDLVSREHSRFYRQGVDYFVVDLDSSNGTRVNGKKVAEPVLLTSGDIVEIGSSILRFMVVNPQVQNVQGVKDYGSSKDSRHVAVEKIDSMPSDTQIKSIEKSYGFEKDGSKIKSKNKLVPTIFLLAIIAFVIFLLLPKSKPQEPPANANNNNVKIEEPIPAEEAIPEVKCEEQGSFCQQPLAVQKQLLAEYEVAVKLFKNFQYELAEDRVQQILAKVSDWDKAKELLEVSTKAKDELLNQKKQEEEETMRKELEKKVATYLQEAQSLMRQEKYEQVKELISKIFEIDPNNQGAKDLADKITAMETKRKNLADNRAKFLVTLSKYEKIFAEGKKYHDTKEYRKAIESLQKCISYPPTEGDKITEIRNDCKKLLNESNEKLKVTVTPELSGGMEAYTNGRYKEAIEAYGRVLKMDYKNNEAKDGIRKSKEALEEEAREVFSRAAIAESVSDYATACPLYNRVLEIAIPGSKYYNSASEKAKKRCGTKL